MKQQQQLQSKNNNCLGRSQKHSTRGQNNLKPCGTTMAEGNVNKETALACKAAQHKNKTESEKLDVGGRGFAVRCNTTGRSSNVCIHTCWMNVAFRKRSLYYPLVQAAVQLLLQLFLSCSNNFMKNMK